MTNEEKAKEIIKMSETKQVYDIVDIKSLEEALYDDLMQMAQWKDEQFKAEKQALIDKACEWLEHNVWEYTGFDSYELSEAFKNAMKGE